MDYVVNILDTCDLYPNFGIPILVNKSLITVDQNGTLSMHDLIQQMGKEVVWQESPEILGKCSRLWYYKDALEVLTRRKVLVLSFQIFKRDNYSKPTCGMARFHFAYPWFKTLHFTHLRLVPLAFRNPPLCLLLEKHIFIQKQI